MFHSALKTIKQSSGFIQFSIKNYMLGLLLSADKKNCSSIIKSLGFKKNSVYKFFDDFEDKKIAAANHLISMVNLFATKENPGILIVDSTQIAKLYSKKSNLLCYDFNGSTKSVTKGFSCVVAAWTNGKILIPLSFDFWIRKDDIKDGRIYKKKTEIAKKLILELKDKISFRYTALDGDYGNEDFIRFLHDNKLFYSMRMPKNRKITIAGQEHILGQHPFFKLQRNERYKTASCIYKGISTQVTSHKRNGPNKTKQVVFVISNLKGLTPKQHIEAYELRWPIEKMFRTSKQHLGLQDCRSTSSEKQCAHILAVFLVFTELEMQKIFKKKKSPEAVLKILRVQNVVKINPQFKLGDGFIM